MQMPAHPEVEAFRISIPTIFYLYIEIRNVTTSGSLAYAQGSRVPAGADWRAPREIEINES